MLSLLIIAFTLPSVFSEKPYPTTSPTDSPTTLSPTDSPTDSPTTLSPTPSPSASPTHSPTLPPDLHIWWEKNIQHKLNARPDYTTPPVDLKPHTPWWEEYRQEQSNTVPYVPRKKGKTVLPFCLGFGSNCSPLYVQY